MKCVFVLLTEPRAEVRDYDKWELSPVSQNHTLESYAGGNSGVKGVAWTVGGGSGVKSCGILLCAYYVIAM